MRIVVCILTVLISITPTTQVLAQAEQQEQEPQATQSDDEQKAALTDARVAEPDTVQLLRLGATSLFPKTDSSPAALSPAATVTVDTHPGPVDPLLYIGAIVLVIVLVVVGAIIIFDCSAGPALCS